MYHRSFAFVVLAVGISLAGYAAFQADAYISQVRAEQIVVQEVETEPVTIFARDLPRGYLITPDDLTTIEYVVGEIVVAVVDSPVGQYTTRAVSAGQPVVATAVSEEDVPLQGTFIRVRRGTEVTRACIAFCDEVES